MKLTHLSGKKIAIMVASGFDETGFIAIQRAMMEAGAKLKIVSREAGLTNAWNGTGWGMSYPADATLSTALAIDYDGLIIPAGKRHIDTLENEAHAKRVLRAFLREDMPVLLQGDAPAMLQLVDGAADRPHSTADDSRGAPVVDGRLVTTHGSSQRWTRPTWIDGATLPIEEHARIWALPQQWSAREQREREVHYRRAVSVTLMRPATQSWPSQPAAQSGRRSSRSFPSAV